MQRDWEKLLKERDRLQLAVNMRSKDLDKSMEERAALKEKLNIALNKVDEVSEKNGALMHERDALKAELELVKSAEKANNLALNEAVKKSIQLDDELTALKSGEVIEVKQGYVLGFHWHIYKDGKLIPPGGDDKDDFSGFWRRIEGGGE